MKLSGDKFTVLTSYDACFSKLISQLGVEVILVGDSLGMVLQGHDSTVPVTLETMAYHTESVMRGNQGSLIMSDLPFMTYATPEQALDSAALLMQAGANMIKIEGGHWLAETVSLLTERGIPVCTHLGLTPQTVNQLGGYRVQGREQTDADRIAADAAELEKAGASCILLECVPSGLAKRITQAANVPVIGIGAGKDTDAQVLVLHDILGITPGRRPKFVKNFMEGANSISDAVSCYVTEVKAGNFPDKEHEFE